MFHKIISKNGEGFCHEGNPESIILMNSRPSDIIEKGCCIYLLNPRTPLEKME